MSKQQPQSGLVPRLRFPEFREAGEWEKKPLGQMATLHKGKGISKSDIKPNGSQPCIRYGELYTIYGEVIDKIASKTDLSPSDLFLSHKDDVIIPSSGETKIDIATAACVKHKNIALGGDLNVIRSDQNGVFLSYQLNGVLKHEIAKVAQGDTVVHLYKNNLEKLVLALPSPEEQQKIADCLSSIDVLIAAQADKLDALKTHKKGLMQQLFSREGETVPRLRFPEFLEAGEWELDILGKLCANISSGKDKSDPEGCYDLYGSTGVIGKTSRNSFHGGYILVARVGANAGLLTKAEGEFGVTDNTLVLHLNDARMIDYIYYLLNNADLNKLIFGSGQPLVTGTQLKSLELFLPSSGEQQKIAACLSSLDTLIAAHAEKLNALKTHKKGLMQQLFPSLEA